MGKDIFLFTWWWRRRRWRRSSPSRRWRRWRRRGPPTRRGRGRRRRAAGLEAGDLCLGVCQLGLGPLLEGERGLQLALHARVLPLLLLARLVHQVLDQRLNVHLKYDAINKCGLLYRYTQYDAYETENMG